MLPHLCSHIWPSPNTAGPGRVRLTESGTALLSAARADIMDVEERLVAGLSNRRRRDLLTGLGQMARNLSKPPG